MWISTAFAALFPAMCLGCGRAGTPLCMECAGRTSRAQTIHVAGLRVRSAGGYAGTLRRAILTYKRGRRDVGDALARLLVAAGNEFAPDGAIVVPVPTVAARRRIRGFDQSARLAFAYGAAYDLPVLMALQPTARDAQRGRDRAARLRACGRFRCATPGLVAGMRVVLVDDVVTTGATLRDCAATLVACGARVEHAIVIAHA